MNKLVPSLAVSLVALAGAGLATLSLRHAPTRVEGATPTPAAGRAATDARCGTLGGYRFSGKIALTATGNLPAGALQAPSGVEGSYKVTRLAADATGELVRYDLSYTLGSPTGAPAAAAEAVVIERGRDGSVTVFGDAGAAAGPFAIATVLSLQTPRTDDITDKAPVRETAATGTVDTVYRVVDGGLERSRTQAGDAAARLVASDWRFLGTGALVDEATGRDVVEQVLDASAGALRLRTETTMSHHLAWTADATTLDACPTVGDAEAALTRVYLARAFKPVEQQPATRPYASHAELETALTTMQQASDPKDLAGIVPRLIDTLQADPAAVERVAQLLDQHPDDARLARRLAGALAVAGTSEAQDALRAYTAARTEGSELMATALTQFQLVKQPTDATVRFLEAHLDDGDAGDRTAATLAYGTAVGRNAGQSEHGVGLLLRAAQGGDDVAIAALGNTHDKQAVDALVTLLKNAEDVEDAARALARQRDGGVDARLVEVAAALEDTAAGTTLRHMATMPGLSAAAAERLAAEARRWFAGNEGTANRRVGALLVLTRKDLKDAPAVAAFLTELAQAKDLTKGERALLTGG